MLMGIILLSATPGLLMLDGTGTGKTRMRITSKNGERLLLTAEQLTQRKEQSPFNYSGIA